MNNCGLLSITHYKYRVLIMMNASQIQMISSKVPKLPNTPEHKQVSACRSFARVVK